MKFLEVATPPPAIYNSCYTRNKLWEDKFTPVNMKSDGMRNVRNHKDINNGDK